MLVFSPCQTHGRDNGRRDWAETKNAVCTGAYQFVKAKCKSDTFTDENGCVKNQVIGSNNKPTVEYSQKEQKFSKTELVKKPWAAHKKLLQEMELRLEGAIERVENLSRDVEINKMLDTYDKVMEKAHSEQEQPASLAMVAEPK